MIELIPAIDLINGQCVRLTKGDYDQKKVYNDNPAEIAKQFEQMGFKRLHVVDLDGAKSKHIVNDAVLKAITPQKPLSWLISVAESRPKKILRKLLLQEQAWLQWAALPSPILNSSCNG